MHGGADEALGGVGLCDVGRGACSSASTMISDINTNLSLQRAQQTNIWIYDLVSFKPVTSS